MESEWKHTVKVPTVVGERKTQHLAFTDPKVCRACIKMWIDDVLHLKNHPSSSSVYRFNNLNVNKVDVCGVVTVYKRSGRSTTFRVDDGTGSIECRMKYNRYEPMYARMKVLEDVVEGLTGTKNANNRRAEALSTLLTGAKKRCPAPEKYKVGDTIRVCGFISNSIEYRTLNAFDISDPLSEDLAIQRVCSVVNLYITVYKIRGRNKEEKQEYQLSPEDIENFLGDDPMGDFF